MPLGLTAFGTGRPREIANAEGDRREIQTRRVSVTSTHPALTDVACKEATWLSKNVSPHIDLLESYH
jgi:hypothetical protein